MTRFARAKGSKSSNERVPESATPWRIMQSQLQDSLKNKENASERSNFEAKRKENYENFLKEESAKKAIKTWCEFPSDESTKPSSSVSSKKKKEKKNKKIHADIKVDTANSDESIDVDDPELSKWCDEYSDEESNEKYKMLTAQLEKICPTTNLEDISSPSKKKKKKNNVDNTSKDPTGLRDKNRKRKLKNNFEFDISNANNKKQKNDSEDLSIENNKQKKDIQHNKLDPQNSKSVKKNKKKKYIKDDSVDSSFDKTKIQTNVNNSKGIKSKLVNDNSCVTDVETTTTHTTSIESSPTKKKRKRNKSKKTKENATDSMNTKLILADTCNQSVNTDKDVKDTKKKKKNKEEYARRKPLQEEKNILIINGEEVEVVNFQGFPVTSKDAQRIQELRKALISKGIPRSEVERTLKLERRRAEKALARLKKNLCFHCRKGGHVLSECPELNKDNKSSIPVSGLCFKCGSTEHTHFACKVVRTQDYKFAQCFVCKEQGHISRQCPDNPRGIYPKGGACKMCGDVTHLKKDCPQILQQRENDTIRLETMQSENVEDIEDINNAPKKDSRQSSIKHVRF